MDRLNINVVSDGFSVLWSIEQTHKRLTAALQAYAASEGRDEIARLLGYPNPQAVAMFAQQDADRLRTFGRQSTLATAFGAFENSFVSLAVEGVRVSRDGTTSVDPRTLNVEKARSALETTLNVRLVFTSDDWSTVNNAKKIRNHIMHRGGMIDRGGADEDEVKQITGLGTIRVQDMSDRGLILIGDEFLLKALAALRSVLLSATNEAKANHVLV